MTAPGAVPGPADTRGRPLRQLLDRVLAVSLLVVVLAAAAVAFSLYRLAGDRHAVLDRIDPAQQLASQIQAGYLDEQTALRGYLQSGSPLFLETYRNGEAAVTSGQDRLRQLVSASASESRLLATAERRAADWQTGFVDKVLSAPPPGGEAASTEVLAGSSLFTPLRSAVSALQTDLGAEHDRAASGLADASDLLIGVLGASLALILGDAVIVWLALRRLVIRPLASVAADARSVTSGDLEHPVRPAGPLEIAVLARDMEAMRQKIYTEMSDARDARERLSDMNADLARSNHDLEQFAYVASHDLQEPLRKVTSFCQLLQQRYGGQLDERGERYIVFAVDGAKRMQVLINDLLAFSRIGRTTERFEAVDLGECLSLARQNLADAIEEAEATVTLDGELPTVAGDRALLVALMQNLIGNAIKFRGQSPPVVTLTAQAGDREWMLSVTDNGIGIEPRFAERIFVIFQRLHSRESYAGTGIGLALCRKIVDFHGGRIWLDVDHQPGTRFCFTLPATTAGPPDSRQEDEHDPDPTVPAG